MKKTKILIADDHSLMRMGLKAMLSVQPDMSVVGEAGDGISAISIAEELSPDVVIMDLKMPVLNGSEATKRILVRHPQIKVIILTSFGDDVELLHAIRNGAVGIQFKEDPEENLIQTIHAVLLGEKCIPESLRCQAAESVNLPQLTRKQSEILHSVSRGLTNKDIARMFGISEVGVQKHLKLIFTKIGAANRSEAIGIALRKHLLKI